MGTNISNQSPENVLRNKIKALEKAVDDLRTNQLAVIVIPKLTLDPTTPIDGQVWYNTTGNVFKKRQNGVTKNWETA